MTNFKEHKIWLRLLMVLIVAFALMIAVSPLTTGMVSAQTTETATTIARLNVREGPGLDYAVIETLELGDEVAFTGLTDTSGDWLQVETAAGNTGWVAGLYLSQVPDPETLTVWMAEEEDSSAETEAVETPEVVETEADDSFSPDVVTAATLVNLNIRSAPGLDAEKLGTLPAGTEVGFTGFMDDTGEWVQVDAIGYPVGWVAAEFLSNVPDGLEVAPEFAAEAEAEAETETETETEAETEMETEDVTGDDAAVEEPPFGPDVVTATTLVNLNIRSAPGLDAEILEVLPAGTVVGFTGFMDETGEWVQVDAAGGPVGWVSAEFLSNVPADLQVWVEDAESGE